MPKKKYPKNNINKKEKKESKKRKANQKLAI